MIADLSFILETPMDWIGGELERRGQWGFLSGSFSLLFGLIRLVLVTEMQGSEAKTRSPTVWCSRLQQGCRQIWWSFDETRFQIISLIRPHEMAWDFSLQNRQFSFSSSPPTFTLPLVLERMSDKMLKANRFRFRGVDLRGSAAKTAAKRRWLRGLKVSAMMMINEKTVCFEMRMV